MKRGSGHIEIILAFILFMAAVGFALYFLSPTREDRLVDSSIEYLFREIEQNTSVVLDVYPIEIESVIFGDSNNQTVALSVGRDIGTEEGALAISLAGSSLDARGEGNLIYVHSVDDWASGDNFFDVYLGDGISEDFFSTSGVVEDEEYYTVGVRREEEFLNEERLGALKDYYLTNYFELKKQFNIPGRVNFGFEFLVDGLVVVSAQREVPQGLDIYSEGREFNLLREGGIQRGELVVRVW